ncbi:hypothetical protein [Variovorax sp. Root473]|uniref:hypothetical protein n=1 Tax=Variovorax sp. Root473 TaxID=1736541 RepID=UPI000A5A8942|nr:hypothetical protein [Variovorax sp. Root473]
MKKNARDCGLQVVYKAGMEDHQSYQPNWVFHGERPPLTYAEKLALYQEDQALRMSTRSRAEYEQRKAELEAQKEKGP